MLQEAAYQSPTSLVELSIAIVQYSHTGICNNPILYP